jgi:hypothetical protein
MLAILLMVAGAIGFGISLVAFDGQLLCLLGSTVVVFAGLWFTVQARRRQVNDALSGEEAGWPPREPELPQQPERGRPAQSPAPRDWTRRESRPEPILPSLTGLVSDALRRQGAQVVLEAQRDDRCILQVRAQSGETFTAFILEGHDVVDVSDVRGLYGLMTASGSTGAFMVSAGSYTAQARDWARQRSLALMQAGQVDEIRVD